MDGTGESDEKKAVPPGDSYESPPEVIRPAEQPTQTAGATEPARPAAPQSGQPAAPAYEGEVIEPPWFTTRRAGPPGTEEPARPQPRWRVAREQEEPRHERPPVERQLAQFAFIREERDREVRLIFHDAPPLEVAQTFRQAGAQFVSLTGDRGFLPAQPAAEPAEVDEGDEPNEAEAEAEERQARQARARQAATGGMASLRYFFAWREIVYTVTITTAAAAVESIASIYPAAALAEQELHDRLALDFTR